MVYNKNIDKAFKKIQECHDGHGRWCASTFKVGVEALMVEGWDRKWAVEIMTKFHEYCSEKKGRWGEILEYEKHLDEISVQEFCDATILVTLEKE
jgi:hypothetical protein